MGRRLGTHPQLIAVLKRAGIDFDESMGITPPRAVCLDGAGKIVIDAVIPARVGERLGVSAAAADVEQRARSRSRWARFLDSSVYFADIGVATRPEEMYEVVAIASRSRSATEEIIRQAASAGGALTSPCKNFRPQAASPTLPLR